MLKINQQKACKKLIGKNFFVRMQAFISKKGFKNRFGNTYTQVYLSMVFRGLETNAKIEPVIREFINLEVKKAEKRLNKKNQELQELLKTAKSINHV
ncbi:hypothetical protein [Mesonia sp. HuA40]|uniref:hypothetical protein n=1 Tax=Mesonia sp. HuA40 TaxID=2602761 RepID=UPI0011DC0F72|nr:hypothetical protein [Mesonia sp. HuA40]TXK73918.1 hypothetical protein FT993_03405 [Mesonia sp. HuA40]